jgi:hypothetical protein
MLRVKARAKVKARVSSNREVVEDVTELSVTTALTSGGEQYNLDNIYKFI